MSPADDSDDVAAGSNLTITFDEPVEAGTGSVIIYNADGTIFETIDISEVGFDGNTVTRSAERRVGKECRY